MRERRLGEGKKGEKKGKRKARKVKKASIRKKR